ncbi:MAG: hypothetical protein N4A68_08365 [Maledivibacter sp.]|jgi:uncharacterized protein YcsI (UPF0317 family)|nr:hypothetical protein [Maledivibacter sp.]
MNYLSNEKLSKIRQMIKNGEINRTTEGMSGGYIQGNILILRVICVLAMEILSG